MTIQEYNKLFPNQKVYWAGRPDGSGCVDEGMLQFDETAYRFAGPFEGNFVYFRLSNHNETLGWKLSSIQQHLQQFRFSNFNFPFGLYKNPAESEEQLQKRLEKLSPKELKQWEENVTRRKIDEPTLDFPFALKLIGTDDVSYSKFFANIELAQEELKLLLNLQPLNFEEAVHKNGFIFTN